MINYLRLNAPSKIYISNNVKSSRISRFTNRSSGQVSVTSGLILKSIPRGHGLSLIIRQLVCADPQPTFNLTVHGNGERAFLRERTMYPIHCQCATAVMGFEPHSTPGMPSPPVARPPTGHSTDNNPSRSGRRSTTCRYRPAGDAVRNNEMD